MDIDQQHQVRYDRQIRLWGDEGQQSIQQARVCVFGSSALAAEILKSLVLAGVGSFHIIDTALVQESDLGQNFFLDEDAIGSYRGEQLVKMLTELNPSVHGEHTPLALKELTRHNLQSLLQFSLVIVANVQANKAIHLDQFLFEHGIPFVFARVCGMLGHFRLSFREHTIWNNHSENNAYDLRLDSPFPELLKLAEETDLNSMTHEQHSHTPYVLLYFKALDVWRKRHSENHHHHQDKDEKMEDDVGADHTFPDIINYKIRKEFEKILWEMRQPDQKGSLDETNFDEAKQNLLKSMGRTKIPENVNKVLSDAKAGPWGENIDGDLAATWLQPFWVLCAALREFIHRNHHLPLSGQLPDMTSDSKRYAQLVGIYREKALADAEQLHTIANGLLAERRSQLSSSLAAEKKIANNHTNTANETAENGGDNESTSTDTEEGHTADEDQISQMSTSEIEVEEQRTSFSMGSLPEEEGTHSHRSGKKSPLLSPLATARNGPAEDEQQSITLEQCQTFCKNAAKLGVQYGSSLGSEFAWSIKSVLEQIQPAELDQSPPRLDPLAWFVLLRATDRFRAANGRFPTTAIDGRDLRRYLAELFAESKDPELIAQQHELVLPEAVNEMCRFSSSEPHVIAAILGGCVAQEVIKLCTHQYVPVDNSLIFDGHSQQAATFRVSRGRAQP